MRHPAARVTPRLLLDLMVTTGTFQSSRAPALDKCKSTVEFKCYYSIRCLHFIVAHPRKVSMLENISFKVN